MPIKLLILGRPGSGKSHAARFIELQVKIRDGYFFRINDYEFLQRQFFFDSNHVRFDPVGDNGFNVLDSTVFDEALVEVRKKAKQCCESEVYDLVIIEFARSNYREALQKFGKKFLQDAYFLYIHTELPTCFERIRLRAAKPQTVDDTFMSEASLNFLYHEDNRYYMSVDLATDFELREDQVICIDNMGSIGDFEARLAAFFQVFGDRIGRSLETDHALYIPASVFECVASK